MLSVKALLRDFEIISVFDLLTFIGIRNITLQHHYSIYSPFHLYLRLRGSMYLLIEGFWPKLGLLKPTPTCSSAPMLRYCVCTDIPALTPVGLTLDIGLALDKPWTIPTLSTLLFGIPTFKLPRLRPGLTNYDEEKLEFE